MAIHGMSAGMTAGPAATGLADAAPVAVGGVGGSGTRLVARMLDALGFRLGADRNEADDTLWFTLLFKQREVLALDDAAFEARLRLLVGGLTAAGPPDAAQRELLDQLCHERLQAPAAWLRQRAATLIEAMADGVAEAKHDRWGWKEPNTHVVLDRLTRALPRLRYIHVMRSGLDMAWSGNRNQLELWGPALLGRPVEDTPRDALAYWCAAHRRVLEIGAAMGRRFLLLDYDAFCQSPGQGVAQLLDFLGQPPAPQRVAQLAALVAAPASLGRHRAHDLGKLDPADVAYARQLESQG
ncbi:MAG TPA: sulfotransferase [Rhodanobacteraceae bacterium]|nr:sulfotransferase [Rhodanobacteraceae bacterium]